jgi:hypothetical protein
MKEVRDIKLDLLLGNKNPIVDLFNEITDGIKIINTDVYNEDGLEFIYYKGDAWFFYQDVKNNKFWCNYDRYWSIFESKLDMYYQNIQEITKMLIEEKLKNDLPSSIGITPYLHRLSHLCRIEEKLKKDLPAPLSSFGLVCIVIEEKLKREVGLPESNPIKHFNSVEDALREKLK